MIKLSSKSFFQTIRLVALMFLCIALNAAEKKVVLVAGSRSHGAGEHEFRAGCLLLQKCLQNVPGLVTVVVSNGWPQNLDIFEGAASIFVFADGGGSHPFVQPGRLKTIAALMDKGVGLGTCHYGVEVPKDNGGPEFLKWTGGYFETFWSVNPHWDATFKSFPSHPITRGVSNFTIRDEWYYHMRFPQGMKNVTALLSALPPENTRGRPGSNSSHGGNPEVQAHAGETEHLMWCIERPDGGRGFGFTGGHFHKNWGQDSFRKIVLNAIVWSAHIEVPVNGVDSQVSPEQLKLNLDPK